jgi:hypothetical protein
MPSGTHLPAATISREKLMAFPTVLLIAGLILLLIGLLGRIKLKEFEAGTDSTPIRVIICLIGASLLITALQIYRSDMPSLPDNSNTINANTPPPPPPPTSNTNSPPPLTPPPPLPNADLLIQIITKQQQENVRESYGQAAGQNFSERDLKEFIQKETPKSIAEQLKTDNEFLDLILAIKRLSPSEQQKLLKRGLNTYKPTWEQIGKIDPKGQTVSGQQAEKMIAKAIVDLVKRLSELSDSDIKKLYT